MLGRQVFWWGRDNVVRTCKFKTRLWLWENKEARSSGREALLTGSSSAVALAAVDGRTSGAPEGTRFQLALNWFKNNYLLHLWQCFEVTSESLRDNSFDYQQQHWKDKSDFCDILKLFRIKEAGVRYIAIDFPLCILLGTPPWLIFLKQIGVSLTKLCGSWSD